MTAESRTLAARLLDRAATIVNGERREQNGPPERTLSAIGDFWAAYLKHREARFINGARHPLDAVDAAHMMLLLKLARALYGAPHPDHWTDMAGYAGLAGEAELLAVREADEQGTKDTDTADVDRRARERFEALRSLCNGDPTAWERLT